MRPEAGPQVGRAAAATWWSAPGTPSTAGRWPPCTPPASRPSTRRSQPLPEGFDHVAYDDLDALEAACDPTRVAAVLLEPIQGEAGVIVPSSDYLARGAGLCDERGILLHGRRGPDRARPHRPLVRLPAHRRSRPTSSPWPRRSATACPSGPAGPGPRWRPPSGPGDHGSTFGGQPLAAAAARATLAVMEAEDVPARAAPGRGAADGRRWRRSPACVGVRGHGLLLGAALDGGPGRGR